MLYFSFPFPFLRPSSPTLFPYTTLFRSTSARSSSWSASTSRVVLEALASDSGLGETRDPCGDAGLSPHHADRVRAEVVETIPSAASGRCGPGIALSPPSRRKHHGQHTRDHRAAGDRVAQQDGSQDDRR